MKLIIASVSLVVAGCSHLPQAAVETADPPAERTAARPQPAPSARALEPAWSQPAASAPAAHPAAQPSADPAATGCAQPQRPGPRPSMADASCERSSNHCLPEGTVFAPSVSGRVAPVFQCGGAWYGWSSLEPTEGPYYQSRPIADREIAIGAEIIFFVPSTARVAVPPSEAKAIGSHWHTGTIARVDPAMRELYVDNRAIPVSFEAARLIVK